MWLPREAECNCRSLPVHCGCVCVCARMCGLSTLQFMCNGCNLTYRGRSVRLHSVYLSAVHQLTTCSSPDTLALAKERDLCVCVRALERTNERQGVSTYVPAQIPTS